MTQSIYQQRSPRDEETGKLPQYAWPGGYAFIYMCGDGEYVCADCANTDEFNDAIDDGGLHIDASDPDTQWHILGYDTIGNSIDVEDLHGDTRCANCMRELDPADR